MNEDEYIAAADLRAIRIAIAAIRGMASEGVQEMEIMRLLARAEEILQKRVNRLMNFRV